jgi:hypothetical protein
MRTRFLKTTKLPVPKPVKMPSVAPVKVVPVAPVNENQVLRQFATKPVVKPLSTKVVKNITKPLNSYL